MNISNKSSNFYIYVSGCYRYSIYLTLFSVKFSNDISGQHLNALFCLV